MERAAKTSPTSSIWNGSSGRENARGNSPSVFSSFLSFFRLSCDWSHRIKGILKPPLSSCAFLRCSDCVRVRDIFFFRIGSEISPRFFFFFGAQELSMWTLEAFRSRIYSRYYCRQIFEDWRTGYSKYLGDQIVC